MPGASVTTTMTRPKRKGRPIHGWLCLDKPEGLTSTDVVNRVRWITGAAKAGHGGTLDPLATGVLPVALGEATKTVTYVMEGEKHYRFTVRLGEARSTDDREGELLASSERRPDDDEIRAVLPAFVGLIEQVPPRFAAVKVAGQRAYDLARRGEAVELTPRPVRIDHLALIERPDPDHATFEMICGRGAYVRALVRDLGEHLGCHAHVSAGSGRLPPRRRSVWIRSSGWSRTTPCPRRCCRSDRRSRRCPAWRSPSRRRTGCARGSRSASRPIWWSARSTRMPPSGR